MPKNLTEALELAKLKNNPEYAAKQIVKTIEERKPDYRFERNTYHAAPRTEMY